MQRAHNFDSRYLPHGCQSFLLFANNRNHLNLTVLSLQGSIILTGSLLPCKAMYRTFQIGLHIVYKFLKLSTKNGTHAQCDTTLTDVCVCYEKSARNMMQ